MGFVDGRSGDEHKGLVLIPYYFFCLYMFSNSAGVVLCAFMRDE